MYRHVGNGTFQAISPKQVVTQISAGISTRSMEVRNRHQQENAFVPMGFG